MNKKTIKFAGLALGMAMAVAGIGAAISASRDAVEVKAADTYSQLTSIANIDEDAQYVLGIDGTGFHYDGTSSWGKTALPTSHTPYYYSLAVASDGKSFTASTKISSTTYYLQVPTSNTFGMVTSAGTNTDLIIGTTQVSGTNYAVANKSTTNRHLRINGTSGLRSYAGTTGSMAFFYKVVPAKTVSSVDKSTDPTKVEYKIGEAFDPTGLKVTVTYSDDSTSEVTYSSENASSFEFTGFDSSAAAEDQEVTVKYTVGETQYTCATKVVVDIINVVPNAILVDPTNMKTDYTVGDKLDLSGLSIDVGYTDDSDEVITIVDNADFVAKGFSLTLNDTAFDLDTALSADHNGASFVVHLGELDDSSDPIEINVTAPQKYTLVTSVTQLTIGNKVLITAQSSGKTYVAKAYSSGNNVGGVVTNLVDGKIVKDESFSAMTIGAAKDGFTLLDENSNYLYAASTTSNHLKGQTKAGANAYWTITVSGSSFSVFATNNDDHGVMQFNPNNGSPIFACYGSATQTAIKLYVLDTNPSDADKVETFSQLYMHKSDIDHADSNTHESATDTCVAYFDAAKAALDGAWSDIASAFAASGAMWDRFVSWGAAKGTTVSYNDAIVYNAVTIIRGGSFNNSALIIASVLAVGAISAGALVLLRRRKEN